MKLEFMATNNFKMLSKGGNIVNDYIGNFYYSSIYCRNTKAFPFQHV